VRPPSSISPSRSSTRSPGPFEASELRSEYRESLREMLEAKLQGVELEAPVERSRRRSST
jgi:hypothetical protein